MAQWTIPALSTRNSTLPALVSLIAFATSNVTVPVFGFRSDVRGVKLNFADGAVDDSRFIDAKFNLARLGLFDRFRDVECNRASLRIPIGCAWRQTEFCRWRSGRFPLYRREIQPCPPWSL